MSPALYAVLLPFSLSFFYADSCASSPCMNGGTCQRQASGFSCRCPRFYSGERCEVGKSMIQHNTSVQLSSSPQFLLCYWIWNSKFSCSDCHRQKKEEKRESPALIDAGSQASFSSRCSQLMQVFWVATIVSRYASNLFTCLLVTLW